MAGDGTAQRINTLVSQGQWAQAESLIRRAMAGQARNVDLAAMMSFVLYKQARPEQAEFFAKQVVAARPDDAHALHNLGNILVALGRHGEGLPHLERALSASPQEPAIHQELAMSLIGLHRYGDARQTLEDALARFPQHTSLLNLYAFILQWIGRVEEGLPILRRVVAAEPDNVIFAQHLASMVSYAPGLSEREVLDACVGFGELENARYGPARVWKREEVCARLERGGPLHIGLISGDLREHAVAYLIEALLEHADPKRSVVSCYTTAAADDAVSQRLKKRSHRWRSVHHRSAADGAAAIENDRVDVLIDLSGFTNGNRLDILARKPAPVQMTYMGFPSTTGLEAVDYRVVDGVSDPDGDESLASETLLKLDPCFLSYRPVDNPPPVTSLPCGESGPVTFAAFSALIKFNTPMLELWARVLKAVPGSRLLLKHFAFAEPRVQKDVVDRLVRAGADPALIAALPPEPTARQVLPWYQKVDIALDTFPYNGTTTICEACLMGVPMVSLHGRTPPSRVSRSLFAAVGIQDLCVDTEDQFVEVAAALAKDRARLAGLRSSLRERFLKSSICDGPGFAARMTGACEWAMKVAAGIA
jgi:predicted O-linked N-acetylglucosamine transferase (SPINDLY family)